MNRDDPPMRTALSFDTTIRIWAKALFAFYLFCLAASIIGTVWISYKFGVSLAAVGLVVGWAVAVGMVAISIRRQHWALILAVVLLLRLGMFWVTRGALSDAPDAHYYAVLAKQLSMGGDFTDVVDGVPFKAHAPRLYALLLGLMYAITAGSAFAPFLLNAIVDAATAWLVFATARLIGAAKAPAMGVGVLYFIWPQVIVASVIVQKEGVACLLVVACVWTLARCWEDGRARPIQYGLLLGLLGMAQPAFFLMSAAFPLALFARLPKFVVVRFLGIAAASTILALVPQMVRNWCATGAFVPLTTGFGMNLYINAAGNYDFPDYLNHLPEAAWSRAMVGEGLAIIANNPLVYAAHQSKMMFLAFALEHGQLLNLQALNPAPRLSPTAMLPVMQLPLLGLWAGASAYFRKSPHRLIVAILALALVYTLTVSIWFEFGARHRAYLLPVVLACCASLLNRRFAEPGYQRGSG